VVGGSGSGKGPYQAPVVLDITKVAKVSKSALPTACKASTKHYDVIYQFSYAPVSVTFQTKAGTAQTYAGKPGSFSFSKSVPTLTVALNFKEGVASTDLEKRINTAAPICAVFAGHTEYAADSDASNYSYALYSALYAGPVSPAKPIELGTAALKAGLVKPVIVASATGKAGSATLTTTVKVGSVYQKGVVTVTVDGKRVKTEGTLTGGKLALTLNSTFKKGTHSAEIVFPGGPGALPTTVTKSFSISG
jgi:hypothetical protein